MDGLFEWSTYIWLLSLCLLGNFSSFLSSVDFSASSCLTMSLRNTIRVSNSLDLDKDRRIVRPGVGSHCLQGLSENKASTHSSVEPQGLRNKLVAYRF